MRSARLSGGLPAEEFVVLTLERCGLPSVRLRLSTRKARSDRARLAGPETPAGPHLARAKGSTGMTRSIISAWKSVRAIGLA